MLQIEKHADRRRQEDVGSSWRITKLCAVAFSLLAWLVSAELALAQGPVNSVGGAWRSFTALHTYYLAATGCSDANTGTSPTAPWCTPKHNIVCGDVIIAAAGNYNRRQFGNTSGSGNFGAVSNCPSTSGGIDGTGGIYFAILLCAGPDLMSCKVNGGGGPAFDVSRSNWAIEGFWATQNTNADRACFDTVGTSPPAIWHHIAFINNIASTCDLAGFTTGYTTLGTGNDQTAVIGGIVYNGANSINAVCGSGISIIPINGPDTSSGTHIYISQNFVYKSTNAPGGCAVGGGTYPHSDGEGIIFDTWGNNGGYKYQAVLINNVMWLNGNQGFQIFPANSAGTDLAQYYVFNNTSWGNFNDPQTGGGGEIYLHGTYPSGTGKYVVQNNIWLANKHSPANSNNGGTVYGIQLDCISNCSSQAYILISGNYIWNSYPPTSTTTGPYNTAPTSFPWGSNTYNDPGLTNTAALPTGAPDCTGYSNAVTCMNTKHNVYDLIKPTIAPTTVGYQPPGACKADAYYPTWLKGVVYLKYNSSDGSITEYDDLITKPCGL